MANTTTSNTASSNTSTSETRAISNDWLIRPNRMEKNESIEEYIDDFERIAEANGWSDERAAVVFRAMLRADSEALQIVDNLSTSEQKSFNKIKCAFSDKFKMSAMANIMQLMSASRNPNESFVNLNIRITNLVNKVYSSFAKTNKAMLCRNHLIAALDPKTREKIVSLPEIPRTSNDVVTIAEAIESASKLFSSKNSNNNHKNNNKSKKFCSHCKKHGHTFNECYFNPNNPKAKNKNSKAKPKSDKAEKTEKTSAISSSPATMKILINYRNESYNCLIDSGSSISFFPYNLIDDLNELTSYDKMAYDFNNNPINVIGQTQKKFSIANVNCSWNFCVAQTHNEFLLGYDFLSSNKYKISTNFKNFQISNFRNSADIKMISNQNIINDFPKVDINEICQICRSTDTSSQIVSTSEDVNLNRIMQNYQHLFNRIGKTNVLRHSIILTENVKPFQIQQFRIPDAIIEDVDIAIKKLLSDGIIEESMSDWRNPIVPIRKKDGSIRVAVDFRQLNKITKKDSFPIPRIDSILRELNGSTIFSKIDMNSGYYQIEMNPKDKEKTAFAWKNNLYHFKRMPFGLVSAPQTFVRCMNKIFGKLPFVKIYFDDILIHSKSTNDHIQHIEAIFKLFNKYNLSINLNKSKFLLKKIEFLGFSVSNGIIQPSAAKTEIIKNFPQPKNKKELERFIGLSNYFRNLIENYATIILPLQKLKHSSKFNWSEDCTNSFSTLKNKLSSSPIVHMPNPTRKYVMRPFVIQSDASHKGMGAVLLQRDENNNEFVIEYASKAFTKCELNYPTIKKEATALVWSIKRFHHYLFGRNFLLESDHRPLQWLMSKKDTMGSLGRMALLLQQYDFEVKYIPGKNNVLADALSRVYNVNSFITDQENDACLVKKFESHHSFKKEEKGWYKHENNVKKLCLPSNILTQRIHEIHNALSHV